jgi:predicted phosphodiesterase
MRIGIIADIHGNGPAFDAVRRDLERRGADQVVNLGDLVFRGPAPVECLAAARAMGVPVLLGNTEVWLTEPEPKLPGALIAVREWTRARLRDEDLADLAGYAADLRLEAAGQRLLFVHGSPRSNMEFLFPFTPEAELQAALDGCEADIVICGHTHWAFQRRLGGVQLIGVGSVGLPFDGDSRAAYALLDVTADGVSLTQVRLGYDGEQTLALAAERGFPDTDFLRGVVGHGRRPE